MDINTATKQRIQQLCLERNLTLNKLGTISGVAQSTINNITGGRNKGATISTIKRLCDGLEISIIDFFNCDLFLDLQQDESQHKD